MSSFQARVLQLIKTSSLGENVKCWQLEYYDPFPRWALHNIVLIGDAAHPVRLLFLQLNLSHSLLTDILKMLPFGGQAANQALEDAAALGVLLKGVSTSAEVPQRLQIFEDIKRKRTAVIQILSSVRVGREETVQDKLRQFAEPTSGGKLIAKGLLPYRGLQPSVDVPKTFAERIDHASRSVQFVGLAC